MNSPLSKMRNEIDKIDQEIIDLLNKRAGAALEIARLKSKKGEACFSPDREEVVFSNIGNAGGGLFPQDAARIVFREIVSACRKVGCNYKICALGEKYGWVNDAALQRFGRSADITTVEAAKELLDALADNPSALGFFPVSALCNDINILIEALLSEKLFIVAEMFHSQKFALVSPGCTDLPEISDIYVTKEILTLLRNWFISISFPIRVNLCRSVEEVMENLVEGRKVAGVIPENILSICDGLVLLKSKLEPANVGPIKCVAVSSRMIHSSLNADTARLQEGKPAKKSRVPRVCSIICALKDEMRPLHGVLSCADVYECKLTAIERFVCSQKPWKELYMMDFELPDDFQQLQQFSDDVRSVCSIFSIAGIYPKCLT